MNRRRFLMTTIAGGAALSFPQFRLTSAQEATPVPGPSILNVRWELQQIESNGSVLTPDVPANYSIQLANDGMVYIQADCNRAGGPYTLNGSELSFGEMFSTLALCGEESISDQFMASLANVASFIVSTDASDQLVLELKADGGTLNFAPSLYGVVWQWVGFQGSDGSVVIVDDPGQYTLEFLAEGGVQVLADCNRGFGDATIDGNQIDLIIGSTRMMCEEGSLSSDYLFYLDQAVSWVVRDGMLALAQPADAGIAMFKPIFYVGFDSDPEATPAP